MNINVPDHESHRLSRTINAREVVRSRRDKTGNHRRIPVQVGYC